MSIRGTILLVSALCCAAVPVAAQEPLSSYWQALEQASTVQALQEVKPPALPDDVPAELPGVMKRVREYELAQDRTLSLVAQRELERMLERQRHAWIHFTLGVALARGPDVREVIGDDPKAYVVWRQSNALQRAPRELKRALELDPELHEAAWALAEFALDTGNRSHVSDAMEALERDGRANEGRSLLFRSLLLTAERRLPEAAQAADRALEAGAHPAVALHARAVALLRQNGRQQAGAEAYFEGLAHLDDTSAETYFRPIYPILSPGELQRWNSLSAAERADFLRRFWDVHAALSGVPIHERLAEHYQRLAATRGEEGRSAPMGAGGGLDYAGDVRRLGVRGLNALMLLRHGDPVRQDRILYCGKDVLEIPVWIAPSPSECLTTPMGRLRALMAGETRLARMQAVDAAVPGVTHSPRFSTYLAASWELLQFRGATGQTLLVASLAVPGTSARHLVQDGTLSATVSVALVDTATAAVERSENTRSFAARNIADGALVLLQSVLPTSAIGARQYRVTLTDPTRQVGRMLSGEVTVRRFADDSLSLSDVVLAPVNGVPSFSRGSVRLSPAPGREFRASEEAVLYYEVYGMEERTAFRTEITLTPRAEDLVGSLRMLLPGRPQQLRLSFEDVADAVDGMLGVQQRRTIGLQGLQPGAYELRITVTDEKGRQATQDRLMWIVEDAPSQ